jgi:hypothetical protein
MMEVVLHAEGENYKKIKDKLLTDEVVNRASITFKDAKQFGKDSGYIFIVNGEEHRCKRALELAKGEVDKESEGKNGIELAKEVTGKEKEEILKKIKEEEDRAIEGFGGIFG